MTFKLVMQAPSGQRTRYTGDAYSVSPYTTSRAEAKHRLNTLWNVYAMTHTFHATAN